MIIISQLKKIYITSFNKNGPVTNVGSDKALFNNNMIFSQ